MRPVRRALGAACAMVVVAASLGGKAARAQAQGAVVRGTVRSADGRPLSGAEIVVGDSGRARTDSAGAFSVGGVPAGRVELLVRRVGFTPLSVPLTLADGQRRTLAIELTPVPTGLDPMIVSARRPGLFGVVVDERDAPVAGAEIMVVGSGRRTTSAKDGAFAMPELRGRSYIVLARAPDRHRAQFSVDVPADAGRDVRIVLRAIDADVTGLARRAAAGLFWSDSAFMRDLDRRLLSNVSTTLIPRAELARQADRPLLTVLAEDARAQTQLAHGARGPTSILPGAAGPTTGGPPRGFPYAGAGNGGWCYFLDGEPVPANQQDLFNFMPASWIESIEIVPNDVTNTLNRRITEPGVVCRRFIVVWTKR